MMTVETEKEQAFPGNIKCSVSGCDEKASWEGVFPVCKPAGVSSFRIVQMVRRNLGIKKVGHTGTLDPFASGVLVICVGRSATKLITQLMAGDKEYEATLQLGVITDTQDPEGKVIEKRPVPELSERVMAECMEKFSGEQLQTPPSYSALKHRGKPLYYYARKGIKVTKAPRLIRIKELYCRSLENNILKLRVTCSKGTYIRTLAADIGEYLGCGAHLRELKRTRNGLFTMGDTLPGEKLFADGEARTLLASHRIEVTAVKELLAGNRESN